MQYINLKDYITPPLNVETLIFRNGDTKDIMTAIRRMDTYCAKNRFMRKIAPLFKRSNDIDTCYKVWLFAVNNFKYQADQNHEKVKSSNWVMYYRVADCKSYSITIIDILRELGYSCFYRFVSFSKTDSTPTHVFLVARGKNGKLIFVDAVPFNSTWNNDFRFNEESEYTFYKDIEAASIKAGVSGLNYTI